MNVWLGAFAGGICVGVAIMLALFAYCKGRG